MTWSAIWFSVTAPPFVSLKSSLTPRRHGATNLMIYRFLNFVAFVAALRETDLRFKSLSHATTRRRDVNDLIIHKFFDFVEIIPALGEADSSPFTTRLKPSLSRFSPKLINRPSR